MGKTFFGLNSENKVELHKTLFTMAYYSNGAFNFEQVYNMPVHLRTFHMKQLEEAKKKEAEEMQRLQKGKPKTR